MVAGGEADGEVLRLERLPEPFAPAAGSRPTGSRDAAHDGVDPFARLRADVVAYGHVDPLETLRGLSAASGIPVGALARYVLARWATGGTEAVLELGISGVDHLARVIEDAETDGSDAARLEAYESVREIIGWLRAGVDG